eukprot:TRINITY_DN3852_c0_g1_i5.p2 TRINITY_DN3852_c0_g1~~TRINITY_DN3852_c0_g1_i5.p2  ORF type:complete len:191 (-),score=16.10 TRINITY_DN3852_c0_g1_i5:459-1031(-)
MTTQERHHLKLFCDGDGAIGKTSLLITYSTGEFPVDYIPTVFDNYSVQRNIDGVEFFVGLWEFFPREGSDRLRPLAYPNTDVFLACFSVARPHTLDLLVNSRIAEYRRHVPFAKILLVGLKSDLRHSTEHGSTCVSPEQAQAVVDSLNLEGYMECSALTRDNMNEMFERAIRIALRKPEQKKKKRECVIV